MHLSDRRMRMLKLFSYLTKKQWGFIAISLVFICAQVWLDLKLPDFMAEITTLIQTEGTTSKDILVPGLYMLLCAIGSVIGAVIVGFLSLIHI